MHELIRRARLRLLNQELMSQGAITCAAAFGAFILLLLLGTDFLTWYWVILIPVAAVGIGVFLAVRRQPTSYRTAQLVDHRLSLADTLSTAVYFEDKSAPPEIVQNQRQNAERVAGSVDLSHALPYRLPRTVYIAGILALVASSLFALRYGLSNSLDLHAPLARMVENDFTPRDKKEVAKNANRIPQPYDNPDDSSDPSADQDQKGQDQKDAKSDDAADQGDEKNAEKSGSSKEDGKKQGDQAQNQDGDGQNQQGDQQKDPESGQQPNSATDGEHKGNSEKQPDGKQQSSNGGESGSLMSKLKDFAENLLSKVKPPSPQQNGQQQQQQAQKENGKQNGQQGSKQQQKDGQQSGSQQADSQEGQNGESQKDGQDSQGKGSGQDKSQQANKQPGSGVGSEDGSKEIRNAEQLAAMGKISELIGKRSATVTGEATVEVQSTNQSLHTAYVKSGAEHGQTGAEINRDEIPVALQPYVQQYFDQLHKQNPATPPAVKKP